MADTAPLQATLKAFPWVVAEYCEGCSHCTSACPQSALTMCPAAGSDIQIPWVLDVSLCNGCGLCHKVCIWGGIQLTAHVEEALLRMNSRKGISSALP